MSRPSLKITESLQKIEEKYRFKTNLCLAFIHHYLKTVNILTQKFKNLKILSWLVQNFLKNQWKNWQKFTKGVTFVKICLL